MAPGFLSKFQKHPRERSFSFSRSPSPGDSQPQSQPPPLPPPPPPPVPPVPVVTVAPSSASTTSLSKKKTSRSHTPEPDGLSVHTNRSVTIGIIPPSPRNTVHSVSSDDAAPKPEEKRKPTLSFSKHSRPVEDPLVTPTPAKPLTPASSTGNLRQFVQQAEAGSMRNGDSANASAASLQPSEKSARSQPPAPIPIAHARGSTTSSTASVDAGPVDESVILSSMSPISESPDGMRSFSSSPPQSPSFDPISRTQTQQTINPNMLAPGGKDPDSVSMVSSAGDKKKSKWRRPSKKPTGLASAIAASGLAMANPAMTAPQMAQAAQIQTPVTATSTSPPKQNGQRKNSGGHRHGASASAASVGSNSLDTPKRTRTHSFSNRSDNSEGMYDSGLEGISSDGDDSGSEDELDLREDIPVTGFAVASNKRNADFHELFSNIPEGDYLIEGLSACYSFAIVLTPSLQTMDVRFSAKF